MIELYDILNEMKGKNEKGEAKSGVHVSEQLIDATDVVKTIKEYSFTAPYIDLIVNNNFIIIDLIFPKDRLAELRTAWSYLKSFGEKQNEYLDGSATPLLEFTFVPLKYNGKYFCSVVNPVYWAMQPSAPGSQIDSIRLLFEHEAVNFFEGDEINEKDVEKEIETELKERQRMEEIESIKDAEHEEYLEKLNKKFNHLED